MCVFCALQGQKRRESEQNKEHFYKKQSCDSPVLSADDLENFARLCPPFGLFQCMEKLPSTVKYFPSVRDKEVTQIKS